MSVLGELRQYAQLAWGLWGFYRQRITVDQAREIVLRRMAEREANFLAVVERAIFGHPSSPYLPLLKRAGCELGDLRGMVRSRGLEAALRALYASGVHVTYEEFKAERPIVRGGLEIPVTRASFNNPFPTRSFVISSSGTSGTPSVFRSDLTHLLSRAPHTLLAYEAHGVLGAPTAVWRGGLPEGGGVASMLRGALIGQIPQRWFSPFMPQFIMPSIKDRFTTFYVVLVGRLQGLPIPFPESVDLDDVQVVVRWMTDTLAANGRCLIRCLPSVALRICNAARERGFDLTGAVFMGGGEPPTPAKVREIVRTNARWVPSYTFSEAGHVGVGCTHPIGGNDLHLLKDALALVQFPRRVPEWDIDVGAFYFTNLLPWSPKVLLNVESDDYGIVETRSCGCPLEALGFTEHVREVYSFRKLTSEGLTLVGSQVIRILEEVLPARFGGSALDYQLSEEEDERGLTRLNLIINPAVPIADEAAVIETFVNGFDAKPQAILRQARTIRVKRMMPTVSGRGKLMPLNLLQRARSAAGQDSRRS